MNQHIAQFLAVSGIYGNQYRESFRRGYLDELTNGNQQYYMESQNNSQSVDSLSWIFKFNKDSQDTVYFTKAIQYFGELVRKFLIEDQTDIC